MCYDDPIIKHGGGLALENQAIRLAARGAGIPLWRIAQEMNISEPTITRRLRRPLAPEETQKFLAIINKLSARGGELDVHEHSQSR